MILQIKFDNGKRNHLALFLGELLGKTRLNYTYAIEYDDICTFDPTVTIENIYNSEDMEFVMDAFRKVEHLVEVEEFQEQEEYFYDKSQMDDEEDA